jgi:hypothetical protein
VPATHNPKGTLNGLDPPTKPPGKVRTDAMWSYMYATDNEQNPQKYITDQKEQSKRKRLYLLPCIGGFQDRIQPSDAKFSARTKGNLSTDQQEEDAEQGLGYII